MVAAAGPEIVARHCGAIRDWLFPYFRGFAVLDERSRQRLFITIVALLAIPPLAFAVLNGLLAGNRLFAALALVCLTLMVINIAAARSARFSLWPLRAVTVVAFAIIVVKILDVGSGVSLLWPVCLPPILAFLYGRVEGALWTAILYGACGTILSAPASFGVAALHGSFFGFTLAYAISATFALSFEILRDSAQRAAEARTEELALEEKRFHDFADVSSDWIFELDENLSFTYLSDNWARSVGRRVDSLVGRPIAALRDLWVPGEGGEMEALHAAFRSHAPFRDLQFVFRTRTGDMTVRIGGTPIVTSDGRFAGYRGVALDVSDAVAREAELRDKDRTLYQAQKMEAVGQLTSGVAHDFNNLLTVIGGNLELLQLNLKGSDIATEPLDVALAATQRAADLTAKLLAFSRRQPLLPKPVDAAALVDDMKDMLQRTLGEQIDLSTSSDEDLWLCKADVAQLESALLNLAINARDAMPRGGSLCIRMSNQSIDGPSDVAEVAPGGYVAIEVADSGAGIPESIRRFVFDPFFSTKPQGRGSGLGLSMVQGFAKQSGGDVVIASEEGQGARLRMLLPRCTDAQRDQAAGPGAPPQHARNKRILMIEDDDSVRELVRAMLERDGHTVTTAADTLAGQRLFSRTRPDIVLTDVVLANGESGVEFAAALRRQVPDQPILLISGYPDPLLDTEDALASRLPLLHKPFRAQELALALAALLNRGQIP